MTIYRISHFDDSHESTGFSFAWSKREAERIGKEDGCPYYVEPITFDPNKKGILKLCKRIGSEPANG